MRHNKTEIEVKDKTENESENRSKNKTSENKLSASRKRKRRIFLKQFYRDNLGRLLPAAVAGASAGCVNLLISWLMQRILDTAAGVTGDSLAQITGWCAASIAGFLIAVEVFRRTKAGFIRHALTQYRELAFRELTKKSIGSFSVENTSTYISALTNDTSSIEKNYLTNIFDLINLLVSFFGSIAMMLWYSPTLTLISILLSLLPMAAAILTGGRLPALEQHISEQNAP
ncbi:MAG: hypothetical protein K2N94_01875, partial [Lachnospiraceae bacterium]|nr:hypothetical protein [Lachnospiraceae bacterium]